MTESLVYLVHEPSRWDRINRRMVTMDMSAAAVYGRIVTVFPGSQLPPSADEALPVLASALGRFRSCDYLVLAGDWDLVTWAAVLASRATHGKMRLLKWNNRRQVYDAIMAPPGLWEDENQPINGD